MAQSKSVPGRRNLKKTRLATRLPVYYRYHGTRSMAFLLGWTLKVKLLKDEAFVIARVAFCTGDPSFCV